MSLKLEGADRVKKNIAGRIKRAKGREAKGVADRAGQVLASEIKKNIGSVTDRRTGQLVGSVVVRQNTNDTSVRVGVLAPHAHLVEYGHGGPAPARAHPFFRPAVVTAGPKVKDDLIDGMKDLITKD